MSFRQGQRVGAYVIERKLGAGGMASVWLARDDRLRRHVAIKVMSGAIEADRELVARFMAEIRHHAVLHHPGIVAVCDVFSAGGLPCLAMDFAPGGSLAAVLDARPGRRMPVHEALPLIAQVLDALDHAHRQGMVHRDVKPSNILLDATGRRALLSDFGIALAAGERRRTRTGQSVGTSAYMSPEQIRATGVIDFRSDVYSAACVLYEMLTGAPPFVAESGEHDACATGDALERAAVLGMHLAKTPVAPHRIERAIPPHVSAVILRALQKDPAQRVPGCAEFRRLLDTQPRWHERVPAWLRSPYGIAAAVAFTGAFVLGAMAVMSG